MSNIDYSGFPVKNMSCGIGAAIFYREVRIFFLKNDCKIAFAVVAECGGAIGATHSSRRADALTNEWSECWPTRCGRMGSKPLGGQKYFRGKFRQRLDFRL